MLWTEEERRFLGLGKKEGALLDALYKEGPLNTSALAYAAKLPRVTTMRLLKPLYARGFVSRETLRREVRWTLVRPELVLKRLSRVFEDSPAFGMANKIALSEVGSVTIYRGGEEMLKAHQKLFIAHPGERLYTIEPNGIWKYISSVSADEWVHLNSLIAQKKIVIETIIESGFELKLDEHVDPKLKESFLGLLNSIWITPRGSFDSSTEILIFRDEALFFDWSQLVAVVVKNPSSVRLLRDMFKLLQSTAEPFHKKSATF